MTNGDRNQGRWRRFRSRRKYADDVGDDRDNGYSSTMDGDDNGTTHVSTFGHPNAIPAAVWHAACADQDCRQLWC